MLAVDTNILVYARREETAEHAAAFQLLQGLAEGDEPWALPWPCIYEFLRVVTHPRVFNPPTAPERAWQGVLVLLRSPSCFLVSEGINHHEFLDPLVASARLSGNLFFDARIAALLLEHGVTEILTADEDFRRFPGLKVTNPFQRRR